MREEGKPALILVERWIEWPLYVLEEQKKLVIGGLRKAGWQGEPG